MTGLALLQEALGPLERGETDDPQHLYAQFHEELVYLTAHGDELLGKTAVLEYFRHVTDLMEVRPYERPLKYFTGTGRVVVLGREGYTVKSTGATALRDWVWFVDFRDGLISGIHEVQDLSRIVESREEAYRRTLASLAGG